MMKRNILAVVIPALLVAGAANAAEIYNKDGNKLDLYGKINGLHYFGTGDDNGDSTYVRLGLKGETQIADQLTGYGQWEYQMNAHQSENNRAQNFTRVAFAGLKFGDYGSLDYGRNYGVMYDVGAWTDMLPEFGGDSYTASDNFMVQRGNGMLTYRNTNFFGLVDGLNFAAQYQGKNEDVSGEGEGTVNGGSRGLGRDNGDGYGLSASYDLGWGVSAAGAYFSSDRTNSQVAAGALGGNVASGDKAEGWTTGLKYDANNLYLAATYAETLNTTRYGNQGGIANKTQNVELVGQYQFDFGLRPSIAYVQSKGKDLGATAVTGHRAHDNQDLVKYVDLGATYYFNKNMSTFVDYKINLLKDNDFTEAAGINTDNIVAVGLVYQF